jgi:uncharacterized membrane protein (DUF106 family)
MDIKKFQDSRNTKLFGFEKQYTSLKNQYSSALSNAIKEPDVKKREPLVEKVLSINGQMSATVKDFMSSLNEGTEKFDPKTLSDLTNDLIQYQKDYNEIKESNDKLQTLKIIQNTTDANLSSAEWMYNLYLFGLIALIFLVIYLVFMTPSQNIFSTMAATVSAPAVR